MEKIVTDVDNFMNLVLENENATLEELSLMMNHHIDLLHGWARALEKAGMVKTNSPLYYSRSRVRVCAI